MFPICAEEAESHQSLECPICLEVPKPPIYQCSNGHIVCSRCVLNIKQCEICEIKMLDHPIRCLMAEKFVASIAKHKRGEPETKNVNYCSLLDLAEIPGCNENIMSKRQIVAHMKLHSISGVNGTAADIIQELADFTNPKSWLPVYFIAFGEIFVILTNMNKDTTSQSIGSALTSWRCVMLGNDNSAKSYSVQLSLANIGKGLYLQLSCPVQSVNSKAHSAKFHFSLTFQQLIQFSTGTNPKKLEWTIRVQIGKKFHHVSPSFEDLAYMTIPKVKSSCISKKCIEIESPSKGSLLKSMGEEMLNILMQYETGLVEHKTTKEVESSY